MKLVATTLSPQARANARLMVHFIDAYCVPSFGPFFQGDQPAIAAALTRIDTSLGYIDHFRRDGAFASGDKFSIADCAFIPFFYAFEQLQPFGSFDLVTKRPKLAAWWSRARVSDHGAFVIETMGASARKFMSQPR